MSVSAWASGWWRTMRAFTIISPTLGIIQITTPLFFVCIVDRVRALHLSDFPQHGWESGMSLAFWPYMPTDFDGGRMYRWRKNWQMRFWPMRKLMDREDING